MERIFGDQSFQSLLLYLDDIVIFSTTFSQFLQWLEMVLERLRQHHLKLKMSKCHFFQREVKYLGHVISSAGVATDPEKTRAVVEWRRPSTVTELRSFLGFASYYRRFVEGFAKHAAPLHQLIAELQGSKKTIKPKTNIKIQGHWSEQCRPIAFVSRGLRKTERNMLNYSSMKLEFLALKWAVTEKFRQYLMGSKFIIYTDNNPLSYLQTVKLAAVEQRWASELASFDFEIKYRPGTVNRNADALSRLPKVQPCPVILPGITVPPQVADRFPQASNNQTEPTAHSMAVDAAPVRTQADLQALQTADPDIKACLRYWRRGWPPSKAERAIESPRVLELARQWKRI